MATSYTTFEPHPQDWDLSHRKGPAAAEFMAGRLADLHEIESWLGEDTIREDILKRVDIHRPGHGATVAVRVVNDTSSAVATLNWTGLKNVVSDIILTVPSSRMDSFDPERGLAKIPTVSDSDKHILETKIQRALKPEKLAPAVFSISLVECPAEAHRIVSELR